MKKEEIVSARRVKANVEPIPNNMIEVTLFDGIVFVPEDTKNSDYRELLEWLNEGNSLPTITLDV